MTELKALPVLHSENLSPSKQPTPTTRTQWQRDKGSKRSFWCQGQNFDMWGGGPRKNSSITPLLLTIGDFFL